jgi:hypothetical protein
VVILSFSNYLEQKVLEHVFDNTAYTSPTTVYVGLFTTDPTDAGSGTEVSGGSYARQPASFTVSGNTATTDAAIEFPTATASWGSITHIGIFDALTSGNLLAHSSLTAAKTIESGDVFRIPSGDIDITLD